MEAKTKTYDAGVFDVSVLDEDGAGELVGFGVRFGGDEGERERSDGLLFLGSEKKTRRKRSSRGNAARSPRGGRSSQRAWSEGEGKRGSNAGGHRAFVLAGLDAQHIIAEGVGSQLETLVIADFRGKSYKSSQKATKKQVPKETTLFIIARLEINAFDIGEHRVKQFDKFRFIKVGTKVRYTDSKDLGYYQYKKELLDV